MDKADGKSMKIFCGKLFFTFLHKMFGSNHVDVFSALENVAP